MRMIPPAALAAPFGHARLRPGRRAGLQRRPYRSHRRLRLISGGGDSEDGVAFGIAGGYDFRSGSAVFGIEAEAAESTPSRDAGVEAGRDLYIGGRVGGVVGGTCLLYAKAGYTNARARGGRRSAGTNFDGVRAGAGVECLLGRQFLDSAEYRYSNYGAVCRATRACSASASA